MNKNPVFSVLSCRGVLSVAFRASSGVQCRNLGMAMMMMTIVMMSAAAADDGWSCW